VQSIDYLALRVSLQAVELMTRLRAFCCEALINVVQGVRPIDVRFTTTE